jgi:hypothetical protein
MSLLSQLIDRFTARRMSRWLSRMSEGADRADALDLRAQRQELRRLLRQGQDVLEQLDDQALEAQQTVVVRAGSDWVWRPRLWMAPLETANSVVTGGALKLANEIAVYSDGGNNQVVARQTRNLSGGDATLFGLKIEMFGFSGSYVSVVLDLPPSVARGLTQKHILSAAFTLTAEVDVQCFAVLNLESGPNKERLVEGYRPSDRQLEIGFDLGKTNFDPNRLERLWLEIIFEPKGMNCVWLRDMSLHRSLRREI